MKKLFTFVLMLLPVLTNAFTGKVIINGIYYNLVTKANIAEVTYGDSPYMTDVIDIPSKVEYEGTICDVITIGEKAFLNSANLTSISIPASVTSIEQYAFQGCAALSSISIPNNITKISKGMFLGCSSLTSIVIPGNILTIEDDAFRGCHRISSLYISNSVKNIGNNSFYGCNGLSTLVIPSSVESLGNSSFQECRELTSVSLSIGLTKIGNSSFQGCSKIESISIPSSVTSIGSSSFFGCNGLKTITINDGIITIGSKAFSGCSELKDVYCLSNTAPSIQTDAFMNSYIEYAILHVPVNSIYEYQSMYPWNYFKQIVSIDGSTLKIIPDFCIANSGETCAFFEAPTSWGNIYCWRWDKNYNYTSNNWPGVLCTFIGTTQNGNKVWKWTWDNSKESQISQTEGIIFSDGLWQTADLQWENAGYYTKEGLKGNVLSADSPNKPKCATPTINYKNGIITFNSTTEDTYYVYEIADTDIKQGFDSKISLTATYYISVYATRDGYVKSDVASAILCWIDTEPTTEGITGTVTEVRACPVLIQSRDGDIHISGISSGTDIKVFNLAGMIVGSGKSTYTETTIRTSLKKNDSAILKIGEKTLKTIIN